MLDNEKLINMADAATELKDQTEHVIEELQDFCVALSTLITTIEALQDSSDATPDA